MENIPALRGRIVSATMDIEDGVVAFDDGCITYAGPASQYDGGAALPDPSDVTLLPGLVDIHCHGANGFDFSEGSVEGSRAAAQYLHSRGTTTLLGSLVTATPANLVRNLTALRTVIGEGLLAGSHMEGPFLSPCQHGAHDPELLLNPDASLMAEWLEVAGPTLASVTLAAELPGAEEVGELLAARGVIPSLGHTAAENPNAASFLEAAAAGLGRSTAGTGRLRPTVTHLFNGMPVMHHRSPGPVSASLSAAGAGNAVVELIADGVHLAPETVKMVFDLAGQENIALVTDSMAATGLQDGQYMLGTQTVTVAEGVARVDSTGSIAGGTATLLDVVRSTVAAGVPLRSAVASATAVPASVLGLSAQTGDLQPGMHADVLIVSPDLQLAGVVRRGKWIMPEPVKAGPGR